MNSATPPPLDALLECAVAAAREAGIHARQGRARPLRVAARLPHDVKLALDAECQRIAFDRIAASFPDHETLGEENIAESARAPGATASEYEWIVDPIDGTVNFAHGLPFWCCSVAVRRRGETLAGAVYAPDLDELYTAAAHRPALLNGTALRVSGVSSLDEAMIMTGLDRGASPGVPAYTLFCRMAGAAQKVRVMGCAALDLCRVATGAADAYFESGIYIWDVAAAALIVQKAGGRVEQLGVKNRAFGQLNVLGDNGRLHDALKELLGRDALGETEG